VSIPPLRARVGDAALLAHAFVQKFAAEQNRGSMSLRPDAVARSKRIPGRATCASWRTASAGRSSWRRQPDHGGRRRTERLAGRRPECLNLRTVRDEAEKRAVVRALGRVNGNIVRAAELLGVSRPTLYDLMNRLGLK